MGLSMLGMWLAAQALRDVESEGNTCVEEADGVRWVSRLHLLPVERLLVCLVALNCAPCQEAAKGSVRYREQECAAAAAALP